MEMIRAAVLSGHSGSVYALACSGVNTCFSGGGDRVVAEWDLEHPDEGTLMAKVNDIVYSILPLSNQKMLVGQASGGIHVIDLATRKEERLLQYHKSGVFSLCYSDIHKLIVSLSGDGELGIIEGDNFALKRMFTLGGGKLRGCAWNKNQTLMALGSGDGKVRIYSFPEFQEVASWQAHLEGFSTNAVCFTPDGKFLLTGSRDAHMKVYDVSNSFKLVADIPAHNYAIYSIAFSPNAEVFATASRDKTIKIWNPDTFEVIQRIDKDRSKGHVNSVNKILWHPGNGQLLSASDDRSVMVWKGVLENM
jgi:WD40 repeat protein